MLYKAIFLASLLAFEAKAQWSSIGPGGEALSGISFRTPTDGWICGTNGALFRTMDAGVTWQPITAFQNTSARNRLISVSTLLQYEVAVLAQQPSQLLPTQVFYSQRSGTTSSFMPAFSATVASDDFVFMSNHTDQFGLLVGPGGSMRYSVTQGESWAQLPSGTQNDLWGADSPDGHTYYLVGSKGTIRKGTYPGNVSQAQNSTVSTQLTSVWFVTPQQGYAIGVAGTALRTTDGGISWTRMAVGTTRNLNAVRFLNATTGFIVGDLGTILLTQDGGNTWQVEASGTFETLSNLYATPDGLHVWIVGGSGTVLKRGTSSPLATNAPTSASPAWQAYPNPFTASLTLVDLPASSAGQDIVLLDQLGRLVLRRLLASGTALSSYSLAVPASLAPGIYTVQLRTPGQPADSRRLVRLPD